MQPTRRWVLAAILFLLCPAGLVAQPPASGGLQPLVKLHDVDVIAAGPALTRSVDQDVFVAGDGTLVSVTVAADLTAGSGFASTIVRGVGSPAALAALRQALGQDRVGTLAGSCNAEIQPLGSSYTFGISWFGKGDRTSRFSITNQGDAGSACSAAELGVLQAIETFQAGVIADPATQISSSACTSNRQCPDGLLCCRACGIPDCAHACLRPAKDGQCPLFP
jgi:hypothetical protein